MTQRPDFTVIGRPGDTVFLVVPNNADAEKHLQAVTDAESQWLGKAVAVEHRYLSDFIGFIHADGFEVEGL